MLPDPVLGIDLLQRAQGVVGKAHGEEERPTNIAHEEVRCEDPPDLALEHTGPVEHEPVGTEDMERIQE